MKIRNDEVWWLTLLGHPVQWSSATIYSPPSVRNRHTRCACSLARTFRNFWKSVTLRRVRNSVSLSLRSRGCMMLLRCSLCDHVIHPALASSVTNATSATIRSSTSPPLTVNIRMWASSKGRTSPNSAPISAVQSHDHTILNSRSVLEQVKKPQLGCSGHFEGERVGTPFPLLKICRNAWERRSHC